MGRLFNGLYWTVRNLFPKWSSQTEQNGSGAESITEVQADAEMQAEAQFDIPSASSSSSTASIKSTKQREEVAEVEVEEEEETEKSEVESKILAKNETNSPSSPTSTSTSNNNNIQNLIEDEGVGGVVEEGEVDEKEVEVEEEEEEMQVEQAQSASAFFVSFFHAPTTTKTTTASSSGADLVIDEDACNEDEVPMAQEAILSESLSKSNTNGNGRVDKVDKAAAVKGDTGEGAKKRPRRREKKSWKRRQADDVDDFVADDDDTNHNDGHVAKRFREDSPHDSSDGSQDGVLWKRVRPGPNTMIYAVARGCSMPKRRLWTGTTCCYQCVRCADVFELKQHVTWHMNKYHDPRNQFRCEICAKSFPLLRSLQMHRQTHSGLQEAS